MPVFLIASFRGHYTLACGLLWLAEVLFLITAVATLVSGWDYGRRAERMLDPLPDGP